MGSIDLDPASCEKANWDFVQATVYYNVRTNGLSLPWYGNVWLNPPYKQPLVTHFTNCLIRNVEQQSVDQACLLVNNATETKWFQKALKACNAVCFPAGRIRFHDEFGFAQSSPLHGNVIMYFTNHSERLKHFETHFSPLGVVIVKEPHK